MVLRKEFDGGLEQPEKGAFKKEGKGGTPTHKTGHNQAGVKLEGKKISQKLK